MKAKTAIPAVFLPSSTAEATQLTSERGALRTWRFTVGYPHQLKNRHRRFQESNRGTYGGSWDWARKLSVDEFLRANAAKESIPREQLASGNEHTVRHLVSTAGA